MVSDLWDLHLWHSYLWDVGFGETHDFGSRILRTHSCGSRISNTRISLSRIRGGTLSALPGLALSVIQALKPVIFIVLCIHASVSSAIV